MAIVDARVDFLGAIPRGPVAVNPTLLRPGRRVELVTAVMTAADRKVAEARCWRMQTSPDSTRFASGPAESQEPIPPQPQGSYLPGVADDWPYGRATDWRFVTGGYHQLGPATVWTRPLLPLIAGERTSAVQAVAIVADSINGISSQLDSRKWLFVPTSLTLTFARPPAGEWLRLDADTTLGPDGDRDPRRPDRNVRPRHAAATRPATITGR